MLQKAQTIVHAWLRMDFFGNPHRDAGSALTSTIFSQSFFALALAALLYDPGQRLVPYAAANLSLSTLVVGIGALADPQRALGRRRADAALLRTAPLPRGTIALARAAHGAFYLVLITTGMAIPPAILASRLAGGGLWTVPAYLAHAAVLASLFAGSIALVLRGAELAAGRNAALLLAGSLRALLLGGGFLAFAFGLRTLDGTAADLPLGRAGAWCWPPYWSARWLADPSDLGALGALAGAAAVLALVGLMLPEGELERARGRRPSLPDPFAIVERGLAGRGPLLGVTRFVGTMLYRSASFRARVLPLLGVPVAMTVLAFAGGEDRGQRLLLGMTFQFPAIYLPFLIAFLPHAERAGSGHVFRTSPHASLALARRASLIALATRVLAPILLLAAALALAGGVPAPEVAALLLFSWGLAVLVARFQLRGLEAMPFTVDAEDQEGADVGGLVGFALVLSVAGGMFALVAAHPAAWAGAALTGIMAIFLIRRPWHA